MQHMGLILQMLLSCICWELQGAEFSTCTNLNKTWEEQQTTEIAGGSSWEGRVKELNTFGLTKQQFRAVQPHVLEMERRWNKKDSTKTVQKSLTWKQWQQINLENLALNLKTVSTLLLHHNMVEKKNPL